MTQPALIRYIDIYPVRWVAGRLETLLLRRSSTVRCTGAWESVHGHIESGETAVVAATRELLEETGLVATSLYNLSRAEFFYLHKTDEVALIPAFAGIVSPAAPVVLSTEHDDHRWAEITEALGLFAWPRERRAVADLAVLLAGGTAGPLEDVLRIH